MEIIIHLSSKKPDACYRQAIEEYTKRCSHFSKITIKTYKKAAAPKLQSSSKCFIMSTSQKTISSTELAGLINDSCVSGFSRLEFIIPEGLIIDDAMQNTHYVIGFTSFTLSNELATVALTEQIYRAFTILNNITYHK